MINKTRIRNLIILNNTKNRASEIRELILRNKNLIDSENFLDELRQKGELGDNILKKTHRKTIDRQVSVIEDNHINLITFEDKEYPDNLIEIEDAPPLIYIKGNLEKEDSNAVAIVGTRRATDYGKIITRNLSKKLALNGIVIVSGLARGIDTQAHIGALEAKGRTIAIMGTGIDRIYPSSNRNLAEKISKRGALITELPPLSPPLRHHFPSRNRIISGMAKAVIAVEAPVKSGVFSTVRWALEYGRDVYAVPGDITREVSKGTNKLIKMGAIPLTSCRDIFENSDFLVRRKEIVEKRVSEVLNDDEKKIFNLISIKPKDIERLIIESKMNPKKLISILSILEMKGIIREIGGKRYIREEG